MEVTMAAPGKRGATQAWGLDRHWRSAHATPYPPAVVPPDRLRSQFGRRPLQQHPRSASRPGIGRASTDADLATVGDRAATDDRADRRATPQRGTHPSGPQLLPGAPGRGQPVRPPDEGGCAVTVMTMVDGMST